MANSPQYGQMIAVKSPAFNYGLVQNHVFTVFFQLNSQLLIGYIIGDIKFIFHFSF